MIGCKIKIYDYVPTSDIGYWCRYLDRELHNNEISLLKKLKTERLINNDIKKLYIKAEQNNMHIPILPYVDGNCLFSCLKYYGICNDIDEFKYELATIMLFFRDKKNFIPGDDRNLKEAIEDTLELHFVVCENTGKMYKYDYNAMCIDLLSNSSWNRLNTEILLMIMSIVLNLKFTIFHSDNDHKTIICINENKNTFNIYLGLIDEFHYIPLDIKNRDTPNITYKCPKYDDVELLFREWAENMAIKIGRVSYQTDPSENNENDGSRKYVYFDS